MRPFALPLPSSTVLVAGFLSFCLAAGAAPADDTSPPRVLSALTQIVLAAPAATGDCNDDRQVTVDELLRGVNIALGNLLLAECGSFDANGDGDVTIDELLKAVNNALNGVPTPLPTLTATAQPATATPTQPAKLTATPTASSTTPPDLTVTPTASLTPSAIDVPSASPTPSPTPTASATVTASPTASATLTSTLPPAATETAPTTPMTPTPSLTPSPTPSLTPSPSASPTSTPSMTPSPTGTPTSGPATLFCSTPQDPAPIPDNNPGGVSNVITIPDGMLISDLNVRLDIAHTWVGDLRVALQHIDVGDSSVTILNQPGTPLLPSGCNRNDITAVLDDQALRAAQDECEAAVPTIDGRVRPASLLSAFGGQSSAGMWRLTVSDNSPGDLGSLLAWCLEINAAPSVAPTVSDFTCNGATSCTIDVNQPFMLGFSFADADGNASRWRIVGERADQTRFSLAQNLILPPAANGSVPLSFVGFTCSPGDCPTTEYDLFLVVFDTTRAASAPISVHVEVRGQAERASAVTLR